MDIQDLVRGLAEKGKSKIVLLVADGVGGLPMEPGGPTELEAAKTPNLDRLAKRGVLGERHSHQTRHRRPEAGRGIWASLATIRSST